jgi:hypothetical protein
MKYDQRFFNSLDNGGASISPIATNPAARSAKPEQFIDNSFVAELEKSGFIERTDRP